MGRVDGGEGVKVEHWWRGRGVILGGKGGRRWGLIYAGNADSMESCQIKLAGELAWARAGGSRGADRDRGILDPTQFSPSWDLFFPLSVHPLCFRLSASYCTPHYPLQRSIHPSCPSFAPSPVFIPSLTRHIHIAVVIRFALPFFHLTYASSPATYNKFPS